MSLGVNRSASSTTWVDSAFLGSQAEASFCWALLSLPARGPATANTATQKARTTHLVQRSHTNAAIRPVPFMTPPMEFDQAGAWEHATEATGRRHHPKVPFGEDLGEPARYAPTCYRRCSPGPAYPSSCSSRA